jgi:hypothetical protein
MFTTRDGEYEYSDKKLAVARNGEEVEQIALDMLEEYYGDNGLFEQDDNGVWCNWGNGGEVVTYIETFYEKAYDYIWGTDGQMYEVRHNAVLAEEWIPTPQ